MNAWACLLTGRGEAAIGIVEVFGEDAPAVVRMLTARDARRDPIVVTLRDLDELVVRRIPDGEALTQEPTVELCCHGGASTCAALLEAIGRVGVTVVDAAFRARRAVERRAIDAIRAEAGLRLVEMRTRRAAAILLDQARGALTDAVRRTGTPEEVKGLLDTWPLGRALSRPPRVVIAGRPNAGKSTLFNALVGRERVVVSPIPGTTRDPVRELASLEGIPVWLEDTAGLRETADPVEVEAIRLTRRRLSEADAVICLVEESRSIFDSIPESKRVLVFNKSDLGARGSPAVSALRGTGMEELVRRALAALGIRSVPEGSPVVFTERQARLMPGLAGPDRQTALAELLRGRIE